MKKSFLLLVLLISLQIIPFAQNDYKRTHLWEKEIKAFNDLDKKDFPKKNGVLFVGSSSIRGWRTINQDFPDFRTVNRGFGGSHLEDVNFYAEQIVFPYKPKLIVLYAGENDLVAGKSIEQVFSDFKKFVSLVRQKTPRTRIIFVSLKPSLSRWEFTSKFKELNSLVKAETEKDKRLLYVDVWSPMLDVDGNPKKDIFLADKLHMNAKGYEIWRETLYPHIKIGLKGNFR
ncbi:MAG: SGNH/GDSL hydrolase family protein [Acidobacteriota bacterium]|nr:SGNH/GDSL hydrolase family protein [Acidobacteriota bacterium]